MREMISVAMATYNGAENIFDQVRSILDQLTLKDELIVSDDCSTDNTISILESFHDPRIQIFKQLGGLGATRNFEKALYETKGSHIFFSDQDDLWLPGRVEAALNELERFKLSFCNCAIIDPHGKSLHPSFFSLRGVGYGFYKNLWRNGFHGCCLAIRRELLNLALPFPKDLPMHDWWIGLLASKLQSVQLQPKVYVHYRRHAKNLSFGINESSLSLWQQLQNRIYIWHEVEKRIRLVKKVEK